MKFKVTQLQSRGECSSAGSQLTPSTTSVCLQAQEFKCRVPFCTAHAFSLPAKGRQSRRAGSWFCKELNFCQSSWSQRTLLVLSVQGRDTQGYTFRKASTVICILSKNQIYPVDKHLGSPHQPVTTTSQTELTSGPTRAPCFSITPALILEPILHPTIWWEKGCNTGQLLRNMPVNQALFKPSALLEDTAPKLQGSRFLPALGLLPHQM